MSYLLIGSHTSPFARQLRLVMHERVAFEMKAINYSEEPGTSYLKSVSPINKLPVLVDGTQKIFESRVIYNYLGRKHHWQPLNIEQENLLSASYSGMDTCADLFRLKKSGLELTSENAYIKRQKERIPSVLDYLSPWAKTLDAHNAEHWNFPSMSLYSFLYWAQFRGMLTLSDRPEFLQFLEAFQNKPGIAETTIPQ